MNTYLSTGNEKECYGCLSCVYICPTGAISKEDRFDKFSYPVLDAEKCIKCKKCVAVCPNDNISKITRPIISTFALKHKDDDIRMNSSSGGAFTAISDVLLKDKYRIYGAMFDKDFRVVHTGVDSQENRNKMRVSKYVESSLDNIYLKVRDDLKEGRGVMFTGTPCQVAGLKAFLGKDYNNLFTVDLVCNGVTSPKLFEDYLKVVSNGNSIKLVSFRSKIGKDWETGKTMSVICAYGKADAKYVPCYSRIFSRSISMRESCSNCKFASSLRSGDITIGDFWSISWLTPEFKDRLGVSLVAANSEKGKAMIKKLFATCDIIETDKVKTAKSSERMNKPVNASLINDMFWKYYKTHSAKKTLSLYGGDSLYSKLRRKPFEIIRSKINK